MRSNASWPKPLPNNWLIGQIGGLAVDKHDHIWIHQRPRSLTDDEKGAVPNLPIRTEPRSLCCKPAPSVMEFDSEGNLLQAWGGPEDPGKCKAPECIWPANEHAIFVDGDDNVWLSGNGPNDRMLLEFTRDGRFLKMIGGSFAGPPDNNAKSSVGRAAGIFVDVKDRQVYVADGYLNSRVVKFDAQSGAFLKAWGLTVIRRSTRQLRRTPRTLVKSPLRSRRTRRVRSLTTRSTVSFWPGTHLFTCATAPTIASRSLIATGNFSASLFSIPQHEATALSGPLHFLLTRNSDS